MTKICRICGHDCARDVDGLTFDHARHICMTCARHRAFGTPEDPRDWYQFPDPNKEAVEDG